MSETFLNKAQLTGLTKDARRTEILRAKQAAALDERVIVAEEQLAVLPAAIQHARTATSTDAGGQATISFPSAFASIPTMALPAFIGTTVYYCAISSLSATSFTITVRNLSSGALFTSSACTISWIAVGTLA